MRRKHEVVRGKAEDSAYADAISADTVGLRRVQGEK
jgi:hypothetical protein